ncbi:hypothetical protein [Nocardia nova]|uniref:hypothetical protein n=1 Tax=Nocardia nova TaxID=37330 RepID=UPI001CA4CA96|nr:hypothetical protein [Nocardia nova]
MHPRLTHRSSWIAATGTLPVIEGTVIRLDVARLPSGAIPKPAWLWHSVVDLDAEMVDVLWQAFLRRFDIEHTFRMLKQTLGWTCPKPRDPTAADRWTWLLLAAYTQLRLARGLAADLRRPWEKPTAPQRLTPAGAEGGFGTYAGTSPVPPGHRNPPDQDRVDRPVTATSARHPATTCTSSPPTTRKHRNPPDHDHAARVKTQASTRSASPG